MTKTACGQLEGSRWLVTVTNATLVRAQKGVFENTWLLSHSCILQGGYIQVPMNNYLQSPNFTLFSKTLWYTQDNIEHRWKRQRLLDLVSCQLPNRIECYRCVGLSGEVWPDPNSLDNTLPPGPGQGTLHHRHLPLLYNDANKRHLWQSTHHLHSAVL